jgi:N-acetylglutamate synthase-like GNAT family acetyltransferase
LSATIRSVFVDPDMGRMGLGTWIMRVTEADAHSAGIRRLKVCATLPGVPLYAAMGYREIEAIGMDFGDVSFALVRMEKSLASRFESNAA